MKNNNDVINELDILTDNMYTYEHPYLICTCIIKGDFTPIIDIFSKMNDISDLSEFDILYLDYIKSNNIRAYKAHMEAMVVIDNYMLINEIETDVLCSMHHIEIGMYKLYTICSNNENIISTIYTKLNKINIKHLYKNSITHEGEYKYDEFEQLVRLAKLKYIETL